MRGAHEESGERKVCGGCERRTLSVSPKNCDYSPRREDEKCVRVPEQVRNAEIPQHFQNSPSLKAHALKDDLTLGCSQAERQNTLIKCCVQKHCGWYQNIPILSFISWCTILLIIRYACAEKFTRNGIYFLSWKPFTIEGSELTLRWFSCRESH